MPAVAQTVLTATINTPVSGATLTVGQSFQFSGSASGGDTTFYSYGWNFGDGSFGAGANYNKTYSTAGSYTVELTVTDGSGNHANVTRTITVVNVVPNVPAVNFTVNGGQGPVTITNGQSATLAWTTSDATACTASGAWSGGKATSGSEAVTPTSNSTYTLTCTGPGGSTPKSVTVNVNNTNPNTPAVDLSVNGGSSASVQTGSTVNLSWSSANVSSCTASGDWSGAKAVSGSETTGALNNVGTLTYTLTCAGNNGSSVNDSVTVSVTNNGGNQLIISNVRVTDISQTSAIVRWTTNLPADSRVIYDTTSHSTLGSAPNYGYANSTGTFDTSPKVTEHAVTLTGLSANTQYFFRVLSQS